MGKAENRAKAQAQAEYMKRHNITRKTGACPMGCGAQIANGGLSLINHLRACTGRRK